MFQLAIAFQLNKMPFARCHCFLNSNIYLPKFNLHVSFQNDHQFCATYGELLQTMGCSDVREVLNEITTEIKRRKDIPVESKNRSSLIQQHYKPLHSEIYTQKIQYFSPEFIKLSQCIKSHTREDLTHLLQECGKDVYAFPVFTSEFCDKFCEELQHFQSSGLPQERPNSMNHYGVLLDELGFSDNFLNPLRTQFLDPLSRHLFFDMKSNFDTHKAFTVFYEEGKDTELGVHFDNSEVTFNVCLMNNGIGGELHFYDGGGLGGFGYMHRKGWAVLHRGSHQHAVLPLQSGTRINLVMWMRSSEIRKKMCPMCNNKPILEPVEYGWGDGFKC